MYRMGVHFEARLTNMHLGLLGIQHMFEPYVSFRSDLLPWHMDGAP